MLLDAERGTKKHERKNYPKDAKDAAKNFHQFSPSGSRSSKKPRVVPRLALFDFLSVNRSAGAAYV
jgi:hypothetical protein